MKELKLREDIPDHCTLCGDEFRSKEHKGIYPYPPNHWLCFDCFSSAIGDGLNRLNKRLARGDIDLSVDEIAEEIGVRSSEEKAEENDNDR